MVSIYRYAAAIFLICLPVFGEAGADPKSTGPLPYCDSRGENDLDVMGRVDMVPGSKAFVSTIDTNTAVQLSTGHKCRTSKPYRVFKVGSGNFPGQIAGTFICPSGFIVTGFAILPQGSEKLPVSKPVQ